MSRHEIVKYISIFVRVPNVHQNKLKKLMKTLIKKRKHIL